VKTNLNEIFRTESLRDLVYFPLLFNVIGIVSIGLLYAISFGSTIDWRQLNFVLYLLVFVIEWLLAFMVIRRLRRLEVPLKEFIMPRKKFRWIPAFLVFVSLNALFTLNILYPLIPIPPMKDLNSFQLLFFLMLSPITAGFVEELIWRGYFIKKLLAKGYNKWKTILFSSVSFAFIHGFFIPDKLIVTFLLGLIARIYYVRERNLVVLMGAHLMFDVIAFALKILV